MSKRAVERLQEMIKRELSLIFEFEARDPRLALVTVTTVKLSANGRHATVLLDIPSESQPEEVLALCERDRGFFRSELAKRLDLRHTPELHFKLDEELLRARRIDELLRGG